MGRYRIVRPKEIVRALGRAGFIIDRVSGSHIVLKKQTRDSRYTVVVPMHNRDIKRGTFYNILRQAGMNEHDFFSYLQ